MKKHYFLTYLIVCLHSFLTNAQNFVVNGDFENYSALPTTQGETALCVNWNEVVASSDFMYAGSYNCWTNHIGLAASGNGFMGFANYGSANGASEAVGESISANPLIAGTTYDVGMYVKMTTGPNYNQVCSGVALYGFPSAPTGTVGVHASTLPGATLLWTSSTVNNTTWAMKNGSFTAPVNVNYLVATLEFATCPQYVFIDSFYIVIPSSTGTNTSTSMDTTLCNGTTWTIDATTAGASYLWHNGNTGPTYTVSTAGTYWVQKTIGLNTITDTFNVLFQAYPSLNLGSDITGCEGNSYQLSATNTGATYLWQDGSTSSIYTAAQSGTYWVEVNLNGCKSSDTIEVNLLDLPDVFIGNDTTLCFGDTIILDAFDPVATQYAWNTGSNTSEISPTQGGVYIVEVSNQNCKTKDTININFINCKLCRFFIPNAFSPNADNLNDEFGPRFGCKPVLYRMSIYNRWGELIFETEDPDFKWKGTTKRTQKPTENGTYMYYLLYQFENEDKKELKGDVLLVR